MTKHESLPIEFDGWDACGDVGDVQFYKVKFLEDFGPFNAGEQFACVARMDADAKLIAFDGEAQEVKSCSIKYTVA